MSKRITAWMLVLILSLSLVTACSESAAPIEPIEEPVVTATPAPTPDPTPSPEPETVLRAACAGFDPTANPFTFSGETERTLMELIHVPLLLRDRAGRILTSAASGETRSYNGTEYAYTGLADLSARRLSGGGAEYTFTLRKDAVFSDGTPLTADDLIFTLYVLLDPSYAGPVDLGDVGIVGVREYQCSVPPELYENLGWRFDVALDWETEDAPAVLDAIHRAWVEDVRDIVDYCGEEYAETYASFTGYTPEELTESDGMKVMFAMWVWGYGKLGEDGSLRGIFTGKEWDLKTTFPTAEDFCAECEERYSGDADAYWRVEGIGSIDVRTAARQMFIAELAAQEPDFAPVTSVSGIERVDAHTVRITAETCNVSALEALSEVYVASLGHYGDKALYDYENNSFGFPYGDVSGPLSVREPLGAGSFVLSDGKSSAVELRGNPVCFLGVPAVDKLILTDTGDDTPEELLAEDRADIVLSQGDTVPENAAAVKLTREEFSYIGIHGENVSVEGEADSDASRALRSAFAVVFTALRKESGREYITWPASPTSWIYPDEESEAYTLDPEGEPITGLDDAVEAARAYLYEAGYRAEEEGGPFTEAPEGAKLEYTAVYVGGEGEEPCVAILTEASELFARMGITLEVKDLAYGPVLRELLDGGTQEIWVSTLADDSSLDLYRSYYSDDEQVINRFGVDDEELNWLILQLGELVDNNGSEEVFLRCFRELENNVVEVPCYPVSESILFNTRHLDGDAIPGDLTPYFGWTRIAAELIPGEMGKQ